MSDTLPISALAHLLFCRRRAALVLVERIWAENLATAEGRVLHNRVDNDPRLEKRGDALVSRMLPLRSEWLGINGVADSVEFHRDENGTCLQNVSGRWRPYPVEYKRGGLRDETGYLVQLCAQGMCLEEMLSVDVPEGAIFFGKNRRRLTVIFEESLRQRTKAASEELHELVRSGLTPQPVYSKKCDACSLVELCLPKVCKRARSVDRYLKNLLRDT